MTGIVGSPVHTQILSPDLLPRWVPSKSQENYLLVDVYTTFPGISKQILGHKTCPLANVLPICGLDIIKDLLIVHIFVVSVVVF